MCFYFVLAAVFSLSAMANQEFTIQSPDRSVIATLNFENGNLNYRVNKNSQEVIKDSKLGMLLWQFGDQSKDLELIENIKTRENKTWHQPWGQHEYIKENYEGIVLKLQHTPSKMFMDVEFRVFNDGVGFRYLWPKQDVKYFEIQDELTEFRFNASDKAWWIPAFKDNRYEYLYKKTSINEIDVVHTPMTLELNNGLTVALHEASLLDFASMALKNRGNGILAADLIPWADGIDVKVNTPHQSPWRTIIVAGKPKDLIESTLILNLNEPSVIQDTSWISTGKYVGVWWEIHLNHSTWASGPKHGATTANTKRYIDFSSEHGLNGVLVEGWNVGWDGNWMDNGYLFRFSQPYPDYDIDYLSNYARSKGLGLVGHHETSASTLNYENQMDQAYRYLNSKKINMLKTGYVGTRLDKKEWHHGQYGVRHYTKAMLTGAKNKLMMVVHEPIKPTGLERTYPHLMSHEGVRGQEYDAWSSDGGNPPEHTTILPFTRVLGGPIDFTPGTFDLVYYGWNAKNRVKTTLAKQLALYVVLYSPWQMLSDLPENYLKHPEAFEFLKKVPTNWEKTVGLDSRIGDYTVIARKERGGKNWYLGAITDENGRNLRVNLNFLESGWYKVNAYQDSRDASWSSNPYGMEIYQTRVHSSGSFDLNLAPGGGLALEFIKE